jgi:hypothetical protein
MIATVRCQPFSHSRSKFSCDRCAEPIDRGALEGVLAPLPGNKDKKIAPVELEQSASVGLLSPSDSAATPRRTLEIYRGVTAVSTPLFEVSLRRARYFAAVTDSALMVFDPPASPTSPFTSTIFDANGTSFAFFASAYFPVNV